MSLPKNDIQLNKAIAEKLSVRNNQSLRFLKSYENTLISQYKIALNEIQKDLAKLYEKFESDPKKYIDQFNQYGRKKSLEKQIAKILRELNVKNVKIYGKAIKGQYTDGYYSNQFAYETGMGLAYEFPVLPTEQVKAAILNPVTGITWKESNIKNINELNARVRNTITQSIIQGKSQQKTVRALRKQMSIGANKARTIVATETHRAREMGTSLNYEKTKKSFESLGIKRNKMWLATLDARTRPSHGSADGTLADEDGLFHLFGTSFEAPGLSGIAEEDIHCRCTTITNIEGFSPEVRKDNISKEIIPYKSFSKWAESRGLTKNIYSQKYLKVA